MKCDSCGYSLTGQEDFCPNCGTKVLAKKSLKKVDIKKIIIFSIPVCLIILGVIVLAKFFTQRTEDLSQYSKVGSSAAITYHYDKNNRPSFIDGDFAGIKVIDEETAYEALEKLKDKLYFSDVKDEFKLDYKETSEGITYYRFDQFYKGVKVYNNDIIISTDDKGNVLSFSGYYVPNIKLEIDGKKTQEELEEIVKTDLKEECEILSSQKFILADQMKKRLVYVIETISETKSIIYILDANTGEIVYALDSFQEATYSYTGEGLISAEETIDIESFYDLGTLKNRYRFVDPNRNIVISDFRLMGVDPLGLLASKIFSSNAIVGDIENGRLRILFDNENDREIVKIAVTSMNHFSDIYDYYLNNLNRKSYDNKGSKIVVNIGVSEKTFGKVKYQNAGWNPLVNQMFIGYWNNTSFAIAKDVLGHEFTHGVISKTARFASFPKESEKNEVFETGALDEGISDIMGSLIEGENWTINESISTIRSLENPNPLEYPKEKGGDYYFPDSYLKGRSLTEFLKANNWKTLSDYDNGGIHNNSTVVGHSAYLMYKNGAFKSREEMAKVWYNSLFLMSSYSDFEDCARAVIKTAKNLSLSSSSVKIIEDAFKETKMLRTKKVKINGAVYSGKINIANANIKIQSNKEKYEIETDEEGHFDQELESGVYDVTVTKEGFKDYSTTINILDDTQTEIELASNLANDDVISCKSNNCHKFTIYYLEASKDDEMEERKEVYGIDDGEILDANILVENFNKIFGKNTVETDGKNFKMTVAGFPMDFAWYYRGTDTKYDFNKPITEDVEIEMKLFGGVMDNDFFTQIRDKFKK